MKNYLAPPYNNGLMVIRQDGESFEELLKRFKKVCNRSGIGKELKIKAAHEKPSAKKNRKKLARKRILAQQKFKTERKIQKEERK